MGTGSCDGPLALECSSTLDYLWLTAFSSWNVSQTGRIDKLMLIKPSWAAAGRTWTCGISHSSWDAAQSIRSCTTHVWHAILHWHRQWLISLNPAECKIRNLKWSAIFPILHEFDSLCVQSESKVTAGHWPTSNISLKWPIKISAWCISGIQLRSWSVSIANHSQPNLISRLLSPYCTCYGEMTLGTCPISTILNIIGAELRRCTLGG